MCSTAIDCRLIISALTLVTIMVVACGFCLGERFLKPIWTLASFKCMIDSYSLRLPIITGYMFFEDFAFRIAYGYLKLFLRRFFEVCRLFGDRLCTTRLWISSARSVIWSAAIYREFVLTSSKICVYDFFSAWLNCWNKSVESDETDLSVEH